MCSTIKKLIFLLCHFRVIKADFYNATRQNILFFFSFLYTLQVFLSGSVFIARIVLHSKSFWVNTKTVKGSSVDDFRIKKRFFVGENLPPQPLPPGFQYI